MYKIKYLITCILCFSLLPSCIEDASDEEIAEMEEFQGEDPFIIEALDLVNTLRANPFRCGNETFQAVPSLKWSNALAAAALRHAQDMSNNNFFAHQGSDGSKIGIRVKETGYEWQAVAENIAKGQRSLTEVMEGWQSSSGHCKNIMGNAYTEMGLARVENIWVQVFAKKR